MQFCWLKTSFVQRFHPGHTFAFCCGTCFRNQSPAASRTHVHTRTKTHTLTHTHTHTHTHTPEGIRRHPGMKSPRPLFFGSIIRLRHRIRGPALLGAATLRFRRRTLSGGVSDARAKRRPQVHGLRAGRCLRLAVSVHGVPSVWPPATSSTAEKTHAPTACRRIITRSRSTAISAGRSLRRLYRQLPVRQHSSGRPRPPAPLHSRREIPAALRSRSLT